jgi:O-antigen/teichoic acid export membrane protein
MRSLSNVKINSITGFISQIVSMAVQFISRYFFVKYLGLEILGVSSIFSSILSTLSLAELGFQTAVVHSLYKPLVNNDEKQINDIINIIKIVNNTMGFIFLVAGVEVYLL